MNDAIQQRFKQMAVALVALALVFSVLGPIGTAAGQPSVSVSQSANSTTVNPGDTVALTTEFSVTELNSPQLSATVPDGWTIDSQTAEGPAAFNDGTWTWLAGDNNGTNVSYTVDYTVSIPDDTSPGTYSISADGSALTPADSSQISDDASTTITVEAADQNDAPLASFSTSPDSAQVGDSVSFDASGSSDADGSIASYEWDFGDGSTDSGDSVTHTFSSPGDYDVELTVTDDDGATDTTTQTVSVSETAAPANFQISAIDVESPVTQGDAATVSATVENTGDADGTQTVAVAVDGTTADSQDVTLAGGASTAVSFEIDTDSFAVGDHDVDLSTANDSASGQLTVTEPAPPSDAPETSVSLSPANGETFVGGTTTYELVVDDAQGGVGAYEATVSLDDPSVGSITDVSLQGSPAGQTTNVDVASDGSSVAIDAALMDTADSGSVPVATITVQGNAAGATDLSASVSALGNEAGNSYTVTGTQGASLSVTEKSTSVSLSPTSNEVATGDTTTFDLVVDNAEGGVGAYTATVSVDDPSVGSITDVELQGNPAEGTSEANIAADGSSVAIDAALMNTADSGNVVVATITVQGDAAGSTSLSTTVEALGDEDATTYAVTGTNGASLTVTEITVGNYTSPVTDVDDDGVYEDINGDGEFNIVDIQGLFVNLDDEAVQDNPAYFDFNGDGTVDVVDVQALFNELTT
ncbi:PKD domain-containing protein [Halobellus sp. Atlit-38R]|uniref:PKD domain-containing protein n=1 Tax=Halobellus sp. Atlit-38R TaxID=2282131 RepID=UPI000EF1CFDA|nr:PKD domain-containing protein [Halobellus sp. Atlit-38R]RLM89321.1 PKD domain-containing protein [Halobellus sp. Atlit-38R]